MSDIAQVKDIVPRIQYTATAGQTVFVYPFPIFDAGDIVVEQNGTVLTLSTDYTVSGVAAEDGGDITLTSGASSGDIMTIYRDMALNRLIDYQQNGDFLAENVNRDFDRLWLALQQLQGEADAGEGVGRAWRASADDTLTGSDLIIAEEAVRSGRFVGFDSNGKFTYASPAISSDTSQIYSDVLTMQNDSNLSIGQFVRTAGYVTPGDGGDNGYEIVAEGTGTADGGSFIDLPGSGHQAKGLFPHDDVHAGQFGVVANGSTDDIAAMQASVDYITSRGGGTLYLPSGEMVISQPLVIPSSAFELAGQGAAGTFFNNAPEQNRGSLFVYTGAGAEPAIDLGDGSNLYSGILLRDFGVDCRGAADSIGLRLNNGIINCEFHNLSLYNTAKGSEIRGTGATTSFNNRYFNCTFEHFDDFGIDVIEDGNGTIMQGCKFINSAALGAAPQASARVGELEVCNSIVFKDCSFGSQNIQHHIEVVECQSLTIDSCEIEASGNSTITAPSLIKLGSDVDSRSVSGFQITGCRFLANSKANNAVRLDRVVGGIITGNIFINTFLSGSYISNLNTDGLVLLGNDYSSGTPISSTTGLFFYLTPAGVASFGNGINLNLGGIYLPTNVTTSRSFDADAVTTAELADVVGTIIADLQETRLLQ